LNRKEKKSKKPKKRGKSEKRGEKRAYRLFLARLAGFPPLGSTLLSSPPMRSSSDAPRLRLVWRFLGGALGSDSPRLRVTLTLARLFGRVERGAMVVENRSVDGQTVEDGRVGKGHWSWAEG
jgi:hypothetical protein